jgi:hypothetical protein
MHDEALNDLALWWFYRHALIGLIGLLWRVFLVVSGCSETVILRIVPEEVMLMLVVGSSFGHVGTNVIDVWEVGVLLELQDALVVAIKEVPACDHKFIVKRFLDELIVGRARSDNTL